MQTALHKLEIKKIEVNIYYTLDMLYFFYIFFLKLSPERFVLGRWNFPFHPL